MYLQVERSHHQQITTQDEQDKFELAVSYILADHHLPLPLALTHGRGRESQVHKSGRAGCAERNRRGQSLHIYIHEWRKAMISTRCRAGIRLLGCQIAPLLHSRNSAACGTCLVRARSQQTPRSAHHVAVLSRRNLTGDDVSKRVSFQKASALRFIQCPASTAIPGEHLDHT